MRVCFVRSLEEAGNLLIRQKSIAETAPFAWLSGKFQISATVPVAIDGDVETAGVGVEADRTVRVDRGPRNGMLYISVIDSGAGISSENQKKLFGEIVQFNPEKLQVLLVLSYFLMLILLKYFSFYLYFFLPNVGRRRVRVRFVHLQGHR